jgi:3-deoxy-7-phosphoheptulonate synthase
MLVVMRNNATRDDLELVVSAIEQMGYAAQPIPGKNRSVVGIVGNEHSIDGSRFLGLPGVKQVIPITGPFKLVSREWNPSDSVVRISDTVSFGGPTVPVIAGPCSVESEEQIIETALAVAEAGAVLLRGGAFKPRSSPYSFQGLGRKGLKFLSRARAESGLCVITEAVDPESVDEVAEYADIVQIGSRNMQNFSLLKRAGRSGKPVLLKRGMASTLTELLLSAEYLLAEGNNQIILCERGIRGFDPSTRNVMDVAAIPALQKLSHLPVIADPSHATGVRDLVPPVAKAAIAAGADGIMIEVHPNPNQARSDGAQSLFLADLAELIGELASIATAIGKSLATTRLKIEV